MRQERGRSTSRKFLDSAAGDCFLVNPPRHVEKFHENHAQWENIGEIDLIYGGRRREPGFRIVGECVSRPLLWGLKILTMIHHFLHETWRYLPWADPYSPPNRRKPVDGSVSILDCQKITLGFLNPPFLGSHSMPIQCPWPMFDVSLNPMMGSLRRKRRAASDSSAAWLLYGPTATTGCGLHPQEFCKHTLW